MSRLLGLLALAVLLWLVLEVAWSRLRISLGASVRPVGPVPPTPEIAETLVRCSECGVHVPRESVVAGLCERCRG